MFTWTFWESYANSFALMAEEQLILILCLRELKALGPQQKRQAASKSVDQGTERHDAGPPVVTCGMSRSLASWTWVICVVGGATQSPT